jgi:hypothetical protein
LKSVPGHFRKISWEKYFLHCLCDFLNIKSIWTGFSREALDKGVL